MRGIFGRPFAKELPIRLHDRRHAGRLLGARLRSLELPRPVILALPRGGVPVGVEVARALGAPLDVIVALKLGIPGQPEHAAGAVAPGITLVIREVVDALGISQRYLDVAAEELRSEVEERMRLFRGDLRFPDLAARTVIVVEDGLATGVTAAAAALSLRALGAERVVVTSPVASRQAAAGIEGVDEVVTLWIPEIFGTVSECYEEFSPVTDAQVHTLLRSRLLPADGVT